MTSHCLIDSIPACTAGSALWGKPVAMLDVTHLSAVGQTASAARDPMPYMVEGAMPMPAAPKLEQGHMLVLWRLDAFPGVTANDTECRRFVSQPLQRRFLMTPTARLAPFLPSPNPDRGVLLVTQKGMPNSSSPLRKRVSVFPSEHQRVDLGEMTRLNLPQAKVMISTASIISLITTVWRSTAHCAKSSTCWWTLTKGN